MQTPAQSSCLDTLGFGVGSPGDCEHGLRRGSLSQDALSFVCPALEYISSRKYFLRWGEDGGRVRRGDHLPSHRYSRNTSTRGTAPTEHPLNAGRKRQTSQKQARRGDSERRLNELQRLAQAAAISADPRGGRELRLTAQNPETGASRGHKRGPQRRV